MVKDSVDGVRVARLVRYTLSRAALRPAVPRDKSILRQARRGTSPPQLRDAATSSAAELPTAPQPCNPASLIEVLGTTPAFLSHSIRAQDVTRKHADTAKEPRQKFPVPELYLPGSASSLVPHAGHVVLCTTSRILAAMGRTTTAIVNHIVDRLFDTLLIRLPAPGCFPRDLARPWRVVQCFNFDARRRASSHSGTVRGLLCGRVQGGHF